MPSRLSNQYNNLVAGRNLASVPAKMRDIHNRKKKKELMNTIGKSLPEDIVHYNQHTGFDGKEICAYFSRLDEIDIQTLKAGDIVFKDSEPHMNGKVYGYRRTEVSKIEVLGNDIKVHFVSGNFTTVTDTYNRLSKVTDIDQLKSYINKNPKSTIIYKKNTKSPEKFFSLN